MRDFPSFRKVPQIVQIGVFSNPPRIEDLAGLTIDEADLDALEDCKPGNCAVKIGTRRARPPARRKSTGPAPPPRPGAATALIKEQMLAYVKAYMAGGTDAMGVTVDKSQPKALSAEFKTLLRNSPYLLEYVPAFNQYLETYPKGTLPDSRARSSGPRTPSASSPSSRSTTRRPTCRRSRAPASSPPSRRSTPATTSTPRWRSWRPSPRRTGPRLYLLDLYRTRIDPPTGMLAGVLLGKVKSGVEQGVAMNLKNAKARVEGK